MQLGFVGLGRMGLNMVTRLTRGGHHIVAFDRSADAVARAVDAGEKRDTVMLEDRHGRRRVFALLPASFLIDGQLVTLVRPAAQPVPPGEPSPARARLHEHARPGHRARLVAVGG